MGHGVGPSLDLGPPPVVEHVKVRVGRWPVLGLNELDFGLEKPLCAPAVMCRGPILLEHDIVDTAVGVLDPGDELVLQDANILVGVDFKLLGNENRRTFLPVKPRIPKTMALAGFLVSLAYLTLGWVGVGDIGGDVARVLLVNHAVSNEVFLITERPDRLVLSLLEFVEEDLSTLLIFETLVSTGTCRTLNDF